MFKPLSLFLALRYVRSRNNQGFISFISASSTIGIALGVMVLIVVLSAMNGFEKALAQQLLSVVPHGELISAQSPFENWEKSVEQINENEGVIAAAPVIKMTGMMQHKENLKGLEIRGVDIKLEQDVSDITRFMQEGRWNDLSQGNGVIIGAGIARKLSLSVGDEAQFLLPSLNPLTKNTSNISQSKFLAPIKHHVKVVGIFKFGGTIDDTLAYISLNQAASIYDYKEGQVQGIRLKVSDVFQAPQIVRKAAYSIDQYVYIHDWTRTQGHLFNDIQLVRMVMFIVLAIVIAVASFNIVSTLIMAVNDKKGDIAILITMGASPTSILCTFIYQGFVNGIIGCAVGAFSGIYLSLHLTDIAKSIESFFNVNFLSSDVYFIDFLPTLLNQSDVYGTVITALVMSFLATIYPAWKATKIEPAQVLGQM